MTRQILKKFSTFQAGNDSNSATRMQQISTSTQNLANMSASGNWASGMPLPAKKLPLTTQRSINSYANIRARPSIATPSNAITGGQLSKPVKAKKGVSPGFMEMTKSCKNRLMFA